MTAPVPGYLDYCKEVFLESDTFLNGSGAVLSQKDESGKAYIIAYVSRILRPSEQCVCHYSRTKLELMVLKLVITKTFSDYLLGSKFTIFTDIISFAYITGSRLGMSQIRWLSKCPINAETSSESASDAEREDLVILSHATACEVINLVLEDVKIPKVIKSKVQSNCNITEGEISVDVPEVPEVSKPQCSPVNFQYSIMCLWPMWPMNRPKTLYWGWCGCMCWRYVDEAKHSKNLLQHINLQDPQFTIEEPNQEGALPFADTLVFPGPYNTLVTTAYRKTTHTNQYLH